MKKFLLAVVFFFVAFSFVSTADAYVSVKGYYRKNGTYVAPYVRSEPNGVKYDNYGYKPSQGLYNKTYGTRDNSWNTPTYVTDPNYYTGKNIYDSTHSDTNYSPSYIYTPAPIVPTTPTCPANATYDSLSSNCKCDYGYVVSGGSCVNGNSYCTSKYGYGAESKAVTGECVCKTGYTYDGSKCSPQLTCGTGYVLKNNACISNTQDCINSYGQNVYGVASTNNNSTCYCNMGFQWNTEKTGCIQISTLNTVTPTTVSPTVILQEEQPIHLTFTKTLKIGNRGDDVTKLQMILQSKKYLAKLSSNGYFGSLTSVALKKFQKNNSLISTGYLDEPTRELVNNL